MKRKDKTPFILLALFWVLYQSTLAHSFSYDGLSYALDVEFGDVSQLFHPNHLLYAFFYRLLYRVFQFLGYHGRAIYLMQSLNACVGAAAVGLFGWTVSKRFGNRCGFFAAALFGVSQGLWSEAIDSGCYAVAALGAVLLLELLLRPCTVHGAPSTAFRTGLAHGFIVLLHQMLILVAPAFLAVYFLKTKESLRNSTRYVLGVFLGAVLPYVLVAHVVQHGSWAQELAWILTPAGTPPSGKLLSGFWWTWGILANLRPWWAGFAQSIVVPGAWNGVFTAAVVIFCVAWSVRQYKQHSTLWPDVAGVWTWVLALNLFQFFFFHTVRYTILFMPPLLYILAAAAAERGRQKWFPVSAGTLLLLVAATNYTQAIVPRKSLNPDRIRIRWIADQLKPIDFFLFKGRGEMSIQNVDMVYFAPGIPARSIYGYLLDQYGQPTTHMEGLTDRMKEAWGRGGSVWVEKDLLDPRSEAEVEAQARIVKGTLRNWFRGFRSGRERPAYDGYCLVELKPAFQAK